MTLPLITGPAWFQALVGAVCGLLVAFLFALGRRWLARRRQSKHLTAIATNVFAVERKSAEADEELRARCKAILAPSRGHTPAGVAKIAEGAARRYGYRVDVTTDRERGLVSVGVHGRPSSDDLASIERDIADQLPMTMALEVSGVLP